jgi:hypothetical protein
MEDKEKEALCQAFERWDDGPNYHNEDLEMVLYYGDRRMGLENFAAFCAGYRYVKEAKHEK